MTLVSDIIRDAYRESNLIAIGTEPTGVQTEEALRLLSRVLDGVYGSKEGEELVDLPIGKNGISRPSGWPYYSSTPPTPDFYVPGNARLVLNLEDSLTVYLNPMPDDGERFGILDKSDNLATYPLTIVANGRTIGGEASVTLNTSSINVQYIYRADLGDWVLISPIETGDDWPFPSAFDDMFIILLAARLNPRYDVQLNEQSALVLRDSMMRFKAKYRRHREIGVEYALLALPSTFYYYRGYSTNGTEFNSGYPYLYRRP